uniref:GYF domain-containing protein n=1 Tax=Syphacia muris TaxID=451379 RepID=A0A0N5B171_9BILA
MRLTTAPNNNVSGVVGKLSMNRVDAPALDAAQDYPLSEPIFVRNRYGREDLLALLPKDSKYPDGLQKCQFFIEIPQQPIVLTPLTEAETVINYDFVNMSAFEIFLCKSRLQHNINSSKAMSALSYAERAAIASSNVAGQEKANVSIGTTGQVSQTFWTSGGQSVGRGGGQGTRGGFGVFRGRGGQVLSAGGHSSNLADGSSGNRYAYSRGRANAAVGRGGSTATFNSRAQGLYDPRDPRDRPRQRIRSVSDDSTSPLMSAPVNIGTGQSADDSSSPGNGWSQVPNRGGWRKFNAAGATGMHQHSSIDSPPVNRSLMPEWMVDEQEKGSGSVVAQSGSFDENGQFKASDSGSPKISASSTSCSIIGKLGCPKDNKSYVSLNYDIMPEDVQVAQRPLATAVNSAVPEDEWYYVDPRNSLQGPFLTSHMEAWFKSGYFSPELNVRRGSGPNSHFQTLGELIQINAASPFRSKPVEPAPIVPVHLSLQSQSHDISSNPWTGEISESLFKAAEVEEQRQKLEEKQRRVAEKEKELKEMQENLKRQEEERLMKVREMELKLQKQQEELARREAEERKRTMEREREIEAERKRIAEEIERVKREELEKQRRLDEELRAAREKEFERMKAETERLRCEKEKEEAARRAAEKAEEEARMLIALEEQKKKELEHRERERGRRSNEARKQNPTAPASFVGASAPTAVGSASAEVPANDTNVTSKIEVTEAYAPAVKVKPANSGGQSSGSKMWHASYRTGEEKLITPKVAPWQSSTDAISQSGKREKSLLEIQQEEERQLLAEIKQKQEVSGNIRNNVVSGANVGGVWAASPQKLLWNQSGQMPSPTTKTIAWGGAGIHQEAHPTISLLFDGPSLETSNKKSKKSLSSPTKGAKAGGKDAWQTASKQDNSKIEQEKKNFFNVFQTVKNLFKQSAMTNSSDGFTNWVIQRVKQLNSQVDADVLAGFIENVDNPDEVEDYIIGYLGDSIQVKEFIREFLAKRGDARSKKRAPVKDDLSGPAPAADPSLGSTGNGFGGSGGNSQQHANSGGKKKRKGKGGKLIVDGACLGFKGTADSNRVNIGEIATISAMEVGHR